jgi:thiol:disulfide interchange protein DsbD
MRLDQDQFIVSYDPSKADEEKITATIKEAGYPARVEADSHETSVASSPSPSKEDPLVFTEALATAKRERKPVVLDFYAEWCVPCKRMFQETFSNAQVKNLLERCVLVKIDTDRYPDFARRFGVAALPDIRLLTCDRTQKNKLLDYQDAAFFAKALSQLLEEVEDGEQSRVRARSQ